MASGEHNVTRRDLLGAAAILPLLLLERGSAAAEPLTYDSPSPSRPSGALPLPEAGEGLAWRCALAAVRRAEGAMRAAEAASNAPGLAIDQVFALEEAFGDRIVAFDRALRRLLAAPAPDLPALAEKIALAADYESVTISGAEDCLLALKADANRLAQSGTLRQG